MEEYKGKILGEQRDCCEENREVTNFDANEDGIYLAVTCKVCGRTWTEVLD